MKQRKSNSRQVTSKAQLDDGTMEAVAELFSQLKKFEDKVREDAAGILREADEVVNAPKDNKEIKLGMRNVEILLAAEKRMCTEIDVKVYESPQLMLQHRIDRFMDEMRDKEIKVATTKIKQSEEVLIEQGFRSVRKLPLSGY